MKNCHFSMNSLSSDNEIFLIQRNYKTDTESENDTDDFVSDIPGLEQVKSTKKLKYRLKNSCMPSSVLTLAVLTTSYLF